MTKEQQQAQKLAKEVTEQEAEQEAEKKSLRNKVMDKLDEFEEKLDVDYIKTDSSIMRIVYAIARAAVKGTVKLLETLAKFIDKATGWLKKKDFKGRFTRAWGELTQKNDIPEVVN